MSSHLTARDFTVYGMLLPQISLVHVEKIKDLNDSHTVHKLSQVRIKCQKTALKEQ